MNPSLPEIKQRLLALGAKETDLELMIQDVQKMIITKIFVEIAAKLTPELQTTLTGMKADALRAYATQHPEVFPALTEEKIEQITKETWDSYFAALAPVPASS